MSMQVCINRAHNTNVKKNVFSSIVHMDAANFACLNKCISVMNKFSASVNLWRNFSSTTKTIIFHWINIFLFPCRHLSLVYRAKTAAFASTLNSFEIAKHLRAYKLANINLRAMTRVPFNGSTIDNDVILNLCEKYKS